MTARPAPERGPYRPAVSERMLVPWRGGRHLSRLARHAPPLEVDRRDGRYVIVAAGEPCPWWYQFVPRT